MARIDISKYKDLPTIGFQPVVEDFYESAAVNCHADFMGDTIYKYPHSDEVTLSNKEIVVQTVTIARMLGREPMTGPEYRKAIGMKPL